MTTAMTTTMRGSAPTAAATPPTGVPAPPAPPVLSDAPATPATPLSGQVWMGVFVAVAMAPTLPLANKIDDPRLAVITLGIVLVCAHGLVRGCVHGARPMALLFWTFNGIWLGVGSLYQLAVGRVAWEDHLLLGDTSRVLRAQSLTLICLVAASLAMHARRRPAPPRPVAALLVTPMKPLNVAWSLLAGYGFAGLAVVLLPKVAAGVGGIGGLFTARVAADGTGTTASAAADSAERAADGFLRILPASLALAATFVAINVLLELRRVRDRDDPRPRLAFGLAAGLLVFGLGLMGLYANPLSMSRYISVSMFAAVAVLVTQPRSRRAASVIAGTAIVGLLLVYPLAYSLRGLPSESPAGASRWDALTTNDFDGFQQTVNTIQYTDQLGHTDGLHTLSAALYMLPRAVWPDKARPASLDVAENRGYKFIDLSEPLHAELFLDFGWLGAIVAMAGVGALWRKLDDVWLARAGPLALLVPYLALAQVGLLRGPLGSLVPVVATTTGLLVLSLWLRPTFGTALAPVPPRLHVAQGRATARKPDPRQTGTP